MDYSDFDLDTEDDGADEIVTLDIEEIKSKLPTFKIEKICQIIVCNKYFNLNKQLTIYCMEELANRRIAGDTFKYEEFIDSSFKELPVLNLDLPDLRTMLNQVSKGFKK